MESCSGGKLRGDRVARGLWKRGVRQRVTEAFATLCIYRRYQQAASSLCLEDVTRQDRREWDCEEPPTQCPHSLLPLFVALHQGVCHPCGQEPLRQGLVGMEERPPSQPMEAWQEVDDESARFMLSRRQGRELVVAPGGEAVAEFVPGIRP